MTVEELIVKLQSVEDKKLQVYFQETEVGYYYPVRTAKTYKVETRLISQYNPKNGEVILLLDT